jgi:hypothetical protein
MSGNDPLASARAEVQGLNRKVKELQTELSVAKRKPQTKAEPLTRSSVEAYAGLAIGITLAVFPMTWWLRIPMFAILAYLSLDFCLRSPFTYKWNGGAKGLIGLACASWIVWAAYGNIKTAYRDQEFPVNILYMLKWGPDPDVSVVLPNRDGQGAQIIGSPSSIVTVDGTKVSRYADKYRLWAVCFHNTGYLDTNDIPVSGSSLFDITSLSEIEMRVPWSQQFQQELLHGYRPTSYALVLVPKDVKSPSFSTIRDALNRGGVFLQMNGGPP